MLLKDLVMPDFRTYAVPVAKPGAETAESTRVPGRVFARRDEAEPGRWEFPVFGPDETESNRLDALYQATGKVADGAASAHG